MLKEFESKESIDNNYLEPRVLIVLLPLLCMQRTEQRDGPNI